VEAPTTTRSVEPTTDVFRGSRRSWWRTLDGWITPGLALVVLVIIAVQLLLAWLPG
jgi:hypothetical protein